MNAPIERVFMNSQLGGTRYGSSGEELDEYESLVRQMIDDAVDFEESTLLGIREENQNYYYGNLPSIEGADEGEERINKSTFVSTDVRDTILTVLPSLIRIFTGSEAIAYFTPNTEEQQDMADQAYDYVNRVFYEDNEGFLILHSVFKDAMTVKMGIVKWWVDNTKEVTENTYLNVDQEGYQALISEHPEIEVIDLQGGENGVIDSLTVRYYESKPQHKCMAVPPDEFRIDRYASSIENVNLIGHSRVVRMSDLVEMGLDPEALLDFVTSNVGFSEERYLRNPGSTNEAFLMDGILYGEYFIRVDKDGDGVAELRCIKTVGDNFAIFEDYIVPDHNFAVFNGDPRPHTVIGDCLADITKDIQRIKTNVWRGTLDNLAESNNPKMVINELVTNVEDALSDEVGAIIRVRGDPNAAVAFSKVPYIGADVQPAIDYLDKVRASRTGITEASKGLDPKAMQSTALTGIDAIISGAQERIELIARIFAETGLKRLLKGLLRIVTDSPNKERTIKLRGKWVRVDPSTYDPSMRVTVNPTLGKGTDIARMNALMDVRQMQMTIMEKYGVANNPVVTPELFLNTTTDLLALANIKNVHRYFKQVTPEIQAQIDATPTEPDPASVLAQAELEKVKASTVKAISDKDTAQQRQTLAEWKAKEEADFKRDKLNVESAIDAVAALKGIQEQIGPQQGLLSYNVSNA